MKGLFRGARQSVPGLAFMLALVGCACMTAVPAVPEDRSVTIIEGIDEPPPNPQPLPNEVAPLPDLRTQNAAGLKLAILPNGILHLGNRIAFSISTEKPGYLILVDINADGKLTQIYPNMMSLSRSSTDVGAANLIKPGVAVTIPNAKNPLARFVFTADPPKGNGAIVAILSDQPVQIIDLPETPATRVGPQASVDALYQSVIGLKIASAAGPGKFIQGTWSFAAMSYAIED